jgi:hypothetical protein
MRHGGAARAFVNRHIQTGPLPVIALPTAADPATDGFRPKAALRHIARSRFLESSEILSIYNEAAAALMRLLISVRPATIVDQPLGRVLN